MSIWEVWYPGKVGVLEPNPRGYVFNLCETVLYAFFSVLLHS